MNKEQFLTELSKLRSSSTFLSLIGYRNEYSEVADYNIIFHISYENALKKSIMILDHLVPADDLESQAKKELIESFNKSLSKSDLPVEEIDDGYTRFFDEDGNPIKGVKLHNNTDTLHLYGLVQNKRVIIPGSYPTKTKVSRPLTIAKDNLRKLCPVGKFRQFKVVPEQLDHISVDNLSLLPPM